MKNYLNCCIKPENEKVNFAIWTKNPEIIKAVFKYREKPENLEIVYSNEYVNTIEDARAIIRKYPFINKVFNVISDEYIAINPGITFNCKCGKNACNKHCQVCYLKSNTDTIIERLR